MQKTITSLLFAVFVLLVSDFSFLGLLSAAAFSLLPPFFKICLGVVIASWEAAFPELLRFLGSLPEADPAFFSPLP